MDRQKLTVDYKIRRGKYQISFRELDADKKPIGFPSENFYCERNDFLSELSSLLKKEASGDLVFVDLDAVKTLGISGTSRVIHDHNKLSKDYNSGDMDPIFIATDYVFHVGISSSRKSLRGAGRGRAYRNKKRRKTAL